MKNASLYERIVYCIFAVAVLTHCLGINACAADGEELEEQVAEKFAEMAGEAAERTDSELAEGLASGELADAENVLLRLLTPREALEKILGITSEALGSAAAMLFTVIGILIISAVCHALSESFGSGAVVRGIEFLSASAVTALILKLQYGQLVGVGDFFDGLSRLMDSMIPITGIVWAMGGNVGSASVGTASLYAMLSVTQKLCASTVVPVCCTMGLSAVCSGLSDGELLNGFAGAVKKVYNFLIGAVMTVFVFVLGAQTSIAGTADTAAARGAKLLSSTLIPVVGGAVGDTVRTVAGSVGYIKSVVGVGAIVLIAVITLPTLISLLASRLALIIGAGMADMLGCKREGRLLEELGSIYGFLIGAVAVCSVAFTVAMALFVKCTVALA